ncbi:MAG: hotdog fold thioesterase [Woeseia sp.]
MTIWKKSTDLHAIQAFNSGTAVEALGIEFTEIGPDFLKARMPVDARTSQPYGLLHGGASCLLAESMGSVGAYLSAEEPLQAVGTDINASHVRSATSGWVTGIARPLKLGRRMQFWGIEIFDDESKLVCTARLTIALINRGST